MMEMVKLPIALNPEKKLYEHAKQHGWKIVLERKNMFYELESKDGKYQLAKTN
jgi:phosphoserine phosphatase